MLEAGYLLCTRQGADQSSYTHQRYQQRLDDWDPAHGAILLSLTEAIDEICEQEDTRNLTSVVAEEETSQGGHSSEEDGLDTTVGAIDADRSAERSVTSAGTRIEHGHGGLVTYFLPSMLPCSD